MNDIQLRPQKKRKYNIQCVKNERKQKIFYKAPDYTVLKWEFYNILFLFIYDDVFYNPSEYDERVYFQSNDIKNFYKELTYIPFYKIFGKNGLELLFTKNSIHFNNNEKVWSFKPYRLSLELQKEYNEDVLLYGVDFDRPWDRNILECDLG